MFLCARIFSAARSSRLLSSTCFSPQASRHLKLREAWGEKHVPLSQLNCHLARGSDSAFASIELAASVSAVEPFARSNRLFVSWSSFEGDHPNPHALYKRFVEAWPGTTHRTGGPH